MLTLTLVLATDITPPGEPLRIGVFDIKSIDVPGKKIDLFVDHLAAELGKRGAVVMTQASVASSLNLERQRQLLGCSDAESASCLAELSGALGVDALVVGRVAKLGKVFQVTLSLVNARLGASRQTFSQRVDSDVAVLEAMERAADQWLGTPQTPARASSTVPRARTSVDAAVTEPLSSPDEGSVSTERALSEPSAPTPAAASRWVVSALADTSLGLTAPVAITVPTYRLGLGLSGQYFGGRLFAHLAVKFGFRALLPPVSVYTRALADAALGVHFEPVTSERVRVQLAAALGVMGFINPAARVQVSVWLFDRVSISLAGGPLFAWGQLGDSSFAGYGELAVGLVLPRGGGS